MAARRPIQLPAEEEPAAPTPTRVHLRRPDGLDLEVTGDEAFITRLLTALGVLTATS
jgi:hypothetical protein